MHALLPWEYKCTSHVCGVCVQVPASGMFFLGTALLYILSCSFPVSILDKRVPGDDALSAIIYY